MYDERGDELRKQQTQAGQHISSSWTKNLQSGSVGNSADTQRVDVKPGKNAFARRKVKEQDEAYAAALQAAFDPLAEERHRLVSNAFYQQQQQRKNSGSENSSSSSQSQSPTVVFASDNLDIKRDKKMTKKNLNAIEVSHDKRYSGNLETLKFRTREPEMPERPMTAMSHFIRGGTAKDGREGVDDDVDVMYGLARTEMGNLKLVPEGKESENHGVATFRSKVEERSEKRMLKIMRGSPLTSISGGDNNNYGAKSSSPTKSGAAATTRVLKENDKSATTSGGVTPRSPRKKIFGLNISVPNFRPNTSAIAAMNDVVPSTGSRLVPPKAAQFLGTEEPPNIATMNNHYGKFRVHPYYKMKRIDTSASLPVIGKQYASKRAHDKHEHTPNIGHRKRLNRTEGSYDLNKSSRLDLSEDEEDYTSDDNIHGPDVGKQKELRLQRHDSLQYYNGISPPTPPAKNTPPKEGNTDSEAEVTEKGNSVVTVKEIRRKQVSRHQILSAVTAEQVPAIVGDGRSSPTRDGRYGHSGCTDWVESPRIISVRASFGDTTVVEEDEEGTGNYLNYEEDRPDKCNESEKGRNPELKDGDIGQVSQLLPTFYSPSVYSMAFDAPQCRPSQNQDPSRFYISSPLFGSGGTIAMFHKDFNSEQMQDSDHKNIPSAESTPIRVEEHKDNTFTLEIGQSEEDIKKELELTDNTELAPRSGVMKDDNSGPTLDATKPAKDLQSDTASTMGDFTGFCPSAMPTPLMGHSAAGMGSGPPPMPPLPSVLPSSTLSVSDRPDPQSIITHFDIVHHHMERSAVTLHQSLAASMEVMMEKIIKKIDESAYLARTDEKEHIRMLENMAQEAAEMRKPIEGLTVKLDEIEKTNMKTLSDKLQTVIHVNTKMYKTIETMAGKIGELEKQLASTQENHQKQQMQVQRELRLLQHFHRSDTPLENHNFNNIIHYNDSIQTASQQSPSHISSHGTSVSASAATVTPASFTAQAMPSVPATMSWPSYNYNYGYNYSTSPSFPISRQQFEQMDPQSRRAFVTDHALQIASPDISHHPAFAMSATNGNDGASGDYEQGYGYGLR